jgi:Domain of unknown function (DUF6268)
MPTPKLPLIFLFLVTLLHNSFAQNNTLSQLFYPNITLGVRSYKNAPLGLTGSNDEYSLTRQSISGFVPIRSEVQVGIGFRKKLDIKAVHTVLGVNVVQNDPILTTKSDQTGFKTVAASVIQMQASLRDRLWVYGGGIGFSESNETFFSPQPFFWGGASRMRVLGLHTQILYGSAVVYNQKFRLVPIFGFNKKVGKDWRFSGILPFQASVNKKFSEWFNLEASASMKGYSAGYQQVVGAEKVPRKENYQHLNISLSANAHVLKAFNLSVEGGIAGLRKLNTFNASHERVSDFQPATGPYIGASVRYITSKSKFSSKFLNKMGIGL